MDNKYFINPGTRLIKSLEECVLCVRRFKVNETESKAIMKKDKWIGPVEEIDKKQRQWEK